MFTFVALFGIAQCRAQRWEDFTAPIPIPRNDTLVLGFHGGRDRWDDERVGVGRMAARLRSLHLPGVHVQTVENTKRHWALRFVRAAFDRNRNGVLDPDERASARIILYGQSFGGAAIVKFARQLERIGLPVLLTVQVDSIGLNDEMIPSNVHSAANLYQRNGRFIRGPQRIRAADASRTEILGNWRFDYRDSRIDIRDLPWHKTILRRDHAKMDRDPRVWQKVEELILRQLHA
ncbi:MAG TPA: hypothetical protein VN622_08815 [Clostridia bacterium]|nr:hypothetical protein [Clostridia bacterium]